ncbi:hypothetical protein CEUSTIGMA_g4258.t1 [Chlamydomonas eustigma]|uniref:Uncharacterized protein n=1 Tax=Chlamydomonas eustigma TaxID=1157962 RepID=A0A250X1P6_9CHLO|nr:hypothetical protein CEUSTIGMA_g4258.t1 [Chlamydomonas eustigma]|eukprot:GAX76812.1 hypothetical protein CEUSTIGMA_g4258.t1 [Chlamydomonas eustigma]
MQNRNIITSHSRSLRLCATRKLLNTFQIAATTNITAQECKEIPVFSRRQQALSVISLLSFFPLTANAAYESELCVMKETEEEADACRRKLIEKDAKKEQSYTQASQRDKFVSVSGVPVSVLDSEYVRSSKDLMKDLEQYCSGEVANKERVLLVKKIKAEGSTWVSKYARGGSARTQSARRLYIAVDAVVGFLASNGLAAFPKSKADTTLKAIEQARELLDGGK